MVPFGRARTAALDLSCSPFEPRALHSLCWSSVSPPGTWQLLDDNFYSIKMWARAGGVSPEHLTTLETVAAVRLPVCDPPSRMQRALGCPCVAVLRRWRVSSSSSSRANSSRQCETSFPRRPRRRPPQLFCRCMSPPTSSACRPRGFGRRYLPGCRRTYIGTPP